MWRMNEIIVCGGLSIMSSKLEAILLEHPDITAAAVIGAPSEQWGQTPVAFVEVWGPISFNVEAAIVWVNAKLGKQEHLYEIHIMERLPRNSTGELVRQKLRDQLSVSSP
jgi:acyl-CoA synthetase (AMP-forming)/AMP-acid ligase II